MTNRPHSVSVCLGFILLNALVWLVFGTIFAANAHPSLPDHPLVRGLMAILSFTLAAILLGLFLFLLKRNRIAYFISTGLLISTSLLTIFDQFGLADLAIIIINFIPVILLIKDRAWYIQLKNTLSIQNREI